MTDLCQHRKNDGRVRCISFTWLIECGRSSPATERRGECNCVDIVRLQEAPTGVWDDPSARQEIYDNPALQFFPVQKESRNPVPFLGNPSLL